MQQLSPKKYIETKARTLPIYKCLVNKGWQEAGMASVIVMRQHANGNITGADFLVDLKCLGVKDAHWFFNENEKSMMEKFMIGGFMQPTDYATAHNIVYAGYEFALEFGIQPHKDFAVAKFILEEDTDDIPLIDIETGDHGIPHLIDHHPGQYADALLKLKKNAGEGNYHYTAAIGRSTSFGNDKEWDETDNDNEDDDDEPVPLNDIPEGRLNLTNVRDISNGDLLNMELVDKRNIVEQMICRMELLIRLYLKYNDEAVTEHSGVLELEKERYGASGASEQLPGMDEKGLGDELELSIKTLNKIPAGENSITDRLKEQQASIHQHAGNLFFLCLLYENALEYNQSGEVLTLLQPYLEQYKNKPLPQLMYAFEHFVIQRNADINEGIVNALNLKDAFPETEQFGHAEFIFFRALQLVRQLRLGNMPLAVAYYESISGIEDIIIHIPLLTVIYNELIPHLQNEAEKIMRLNKNDHMNK